MQVKSYIKKEKKSEISNLSFYLKRLEEKRKSNSRDEEGNDKMAAKSNDTGKRKTIDQKKKKKINETRSCISEIKKTDDL